MEGMHGGEGGAPSQMKSEVNPWPWPWETTRGRRRAWCRRAAHSTAEPRGPHSHLWQLAVTKSAPRALSASGCWPSACAASTATTTPGTLHHRQVVSQGMLRACGFGGWSRGTRSCSQHLRRGCPVQQVFWEFLYVPSAGTERGGRSMPERPRKR